MAREWRAGWQRLAGNNPRQAPAGHALLAGRGGRPLAAASVVDGACRTRRGWSSARTPWAGADAWSGCRGKRGSYFQQPRTSPASAALCCVCVCVCACMRAHGVLCALCALYYTKAPGLDGCIAASCLVPPLRFQPAPRCASLHLAASRPHPARARNLARILAAPHPSPFDSPGRPPLRVAAIVCAPPGPPASCDIALHAAVQ